MLVTCEPLNTRNCLAYSWDVQQVYGLASIKIDINILKKLGLPSTVLSPLPTKMELATLAYGYETSWKQTMNGDQYQQDTTIEYASLMLKHSPMVNGCLNIPVQYPGPVPLFSTTFEAQPHEYASLMFIDPPWLAMFATGPWPMLMP